MLTRAGLDAAEIAHRLRCGTKSYDRMLGRYPIAAWDDEVLELVRGELRAAAPTSIFEKGVRQDALDHVEDERKRRQL